MTGTRKENPRLQRRRVLAALLAAAGAAAWRPALAGKPAPLMLAHAYRPGVPLAAYAVSEKYDGVRGYWDGRALWTRGGEPVAAPSWFTAKLPPQALDGELWAGRGQFSKAVSTIRQQVPDEAAWREIRFMLFDLPGHGGRFAERAAALEKLAGAWGQPWLVAVRQQSVPDTVALQALLEQTLRDGGEGLMLHRLDALHRPGRSRDLLKLKPHDDADARVLSHVAGKGKYQGMLGALWVETTDGLRFKLGTGFDDAARRDPPAVGSWISYRYRGETDAGVPRFASFLRVRPDL